MLRRSTQAASRLAPCWQITATVSSHRFFSANAKVYDDDNVDFGARFGMLDPRAVNAYKPKPLYDPRFIAHLAKIGPQGPRMKPRIPIPWQDHNPSVYSRLLHLYRLVYAKDFFIQEKRDKEARDFWTDKPLPDVELPADAEDWQKHCLRTFKEVAATHRWWSPGQKREMITFVHKALQKPKYWKQYGLALNYDMLDEDDPLRVAHEALIAQGGGAQQVEAPVKKAGKVL